MENTVLIERRKDYAGRILYIVAGMLSTYDESEAASLAATGIHEIVCPLVRELASSGVPFMPLPRPGQTAPNGRGTRKKFDWE